MAEHNQTISNIVDNGDLSGNISDITRYKNKKSPFQEVMSQMNIEDKFAFEKKCSQLWHEGGEKGSCLSIFFCEIDFFEAYRANYGEQSASFTLIVVGVALKEICEKNGCFLAHFNDGCFAILMLDVNDAKAIEIAEQFRQAVEHSATEHKYSQVSDIVTLSVGLSSSYPVSMGKLIAKTAHGLETAKSTGCNKVSLCIPASLNSNLETKKESVNPSQQTNAVDFKQSMLAINVNGRRTFQHDFTNLWQQSLDEQLLISMLICKVDCFQNYIEDYGEQSSETLLLTVAEFLNQTFKKIGGSVYHAGGHKFIALVKGGNTADRLKDAESLHMALASASIEHKSSSIADSVTLSAGLSCLFPNETNSMKILMKNVDQALNRAIHEGRNQTSII
jgi:diguanylate cyclase (GGDEF)-like protein